MSTIFIILALGMLGSIVKIIADHKKKSEELNEMIDDLGEDYETYMELKKKRKEKRER